MLSTEQYIMGPEWTTKWSGVTYEDFKLDMLARVQSMI
jgi:hypothetical protein